LPHNLLDDLEDRPLAMARSRTGEQRANSLNSLAASANNATDVSLSKLQLKDRGSAAWNFRQNHVVRKFDQLANDELEELSHAPERLTTNPTSHNSYGATGEHERVGIFPYSKFQ
jgi:hypothetical protein